MVSLKDIRVVTKTVKIEYPGIEGFELELGAVSRELSRKLQEEAQVSKLDPYSRVPVKELDEGKFLAAYTKAAVKGWKGLKYKHLPQLMLVDLSSLTEEELEQEVDYNEENAILLMKDSQSFDNWINSVVLDIQNFRS